MSFWFYPTKVLCCCSAFAVCETTVALVVRKGNPKNIQSWDDLIQPGLQVRFTVTSSTQMKTFATRRIYIYCVVHHPYYRI
jgi:ABC-type sulfate transport system substrate-binding protein